MPMVEVIYVRRRIFSNMACGGLTVTVLGIFSERAESARDEVRGSEGARGLPMYDVDVHFMDLRR